MNIQLNVYLHNSICAYTYIGIYSYYLRWPVFT